jgi:hypothetical protein
MTQELQKIKSRMFAEIQDLCGPSPVVSTESTKAYNKMLFRLIGGFMPRDFMEEMLVKNTADCTWEILRCTRLKSSLMDYKFRPLIQRRPTRHPKTTGSLLRRIARMPVLKLLSLKAASRKPLPKIQGA